MRQLLPTRQTRSLRVFRLLCEENVRILEALPHTFQYERIGIAFTAFGDTDSKDRKTAV